MKEESKKELAKRLRKLSGDDLAAIVKSSNESKKASKAKLEEEALKKEEAEKAKKEAKKAKELHEAQQK
jgi:hypothetical protein